MLEKFSSWSWFKSKWFLLFISKSAAVVGFGDYQAYSLLFCLVPVFIMNWCWNLFNPFSASIKIIVSFLVLNILFWQFTCIAFPMLNHSFVSKINLFWQHWFLSILGKVFDPWVYEWKYPVVFPLYSVLSCFGHYRIQILHS